MDPILVSILLPTRNRVTLVERSVRSLLSLSQYPTQIEIVTAYDDDDTVSKDYFTGSKWTTLLEDYGAVGHACCCPHWGYSGLHKYYTTMAEQSRGRWLMIWNDDAVMLTPNWDQHVSDYQEFIGMLHMTTDNFKKDLTLFPLIPKTWLDLFGQISLHQLNDSWIQEICRQADAVQAIPVRVFHDRFDVTGNNLDATYQNRRYDKKVFYHESMQQTRSQWAERLKVYREQTASCVAKPAQT
jgi:hypothetical protein